MTGRHLRLVRPDEGAGGAAAGALTPADRIRMAARRLGAIGRDMASDAEELRALVIPFRPGSVVKAG